MEESNCIFACCLGHAFSYFDQTLSFISIFLVTANKRNKEEKAMRPISNGTVYSSSAWQNVYKYHYICALPGN